MRNSIRPLIFLMPIMFLTGLFPQKAYSLIQKSSSSESWRTIKLSELIGLKAKDLNRIGGYQLPATQKMSVIVLKNKMKRAVKKNPDITAGEFADSIKQKDKVALIIVGVLVLLLILFLVGMSSSLPD
jgi:hypothetical protein